MLRDSGRHEEPKLNTEHEREKEFPVEGRQATALEITRHGGKRSPLHRRQTDAPGAGWLPERRDVPGSHQGGPGPDGEHDALERGSASSAAVTRRSVMDSRSKTM